MAKPNAKQIKVLSEVTGLPASDEVAERIAVSMGPAFDNFAAIAGTLPLDLEPATYVAVQNGKVGK
ncbi:hypothetical protein E0H22_19710 [Rhodopseudomonas boonkerdii]|uniref:hypothetical protein n=1 Tax=Rhodopseudomonas boonkerdii TaxID=475937 RepID=UPI001E569A84|nr:hypothetical protein [Rhodopseudomonas boonkerdii]UGV27709.1 hypothetical protein E0H22_19710 [Rhodopseudomonas boonkerdii]